MSNLDNFILLVANNLYQTNMNTFSVFATHRDAHRYDLIGSNTLSHIFVLIPSMLAPTKSPTKTHTNP